MDVLVAMSGGVDSSVAAGLLAEAGHRVVGATLKLWGGDSDAGCCSVADVDDARRVAHVLGIDHHVFNFAGEFERLVVDPFVEGHAAGLTPNPCIDCNRHVKFDLLLDRAARLGFGAVATGHHARVVRRGDGWALARGVDARKDQSYVLGFLPASRLERLVLPIGAYTKDEVRAHAARLGLRTWDKPDSQDVCFIESRRGREGFLRSRLDLTPATVVDLTTEEVVGEVAGAELVTVGQRRGVAPGRDGEARYVRRVDLAARRVEVGRRDEVAVGELVLEPSSVTFARRAPADGARVLAQWSAHGAAQGATLRARPRWRLDLDAPARPVAPGQTVVFYRADAPQIVEGAATVAPS
ncbi:MAG: tRNA 2-thiouridine(34) synthase MnmA [Acidobacteriota bacterium]|nr:tRNA 2-thiouridine(34) synthase MnmA [Acidobacteriota bacterium]